MATTFKKRKTYQIKKDYQAKNLVNPFFRHHNSNKKKTAKINWRWRLIAILILLAAVIYGFFASPLFVIKHIQIKGLGRLPENAISEKIWQQANQNKFWPFKQSNIFLFDKEEASSSLISSFNFSKIEIEKKLFHTIVVLVEERPYAFIWQETGKSYYSDSKGYIIRDSEVDPADLTRFPIIENRSDKEMIVNDYLQIDADYLSFIFALKGEVEKSPALAIDRFIIDQEFRTIKVQFKNGLLAYFNTKEDAAKQLDKLDAVVKTDKIKDNLGKVNYVDLRYGDKVFIGNK